MTPYSGRFVDAFADALRQLGGTGINGSDFDVTKLPPHLRFNFAVIDRRGQVVDQSRDITALQAKYARTSSKVAAQKAPGAASKAVKKWEVGESR